MEHPEEIYKDLNGKKLTDPERLWGEGVNRRHAYDLGHEAGYELGKAEQSDYIESMSSLESVLTDVEQLEGEDLPFVKRLIERTVRAVRAEQADPLEGYSNLTAAISAGEPIDWERLDGLKAQCVKPEVGTLHGTLERNESRTADYHAGWWSKDADSLYRSAFIYGWTGYAGWSLWVEGEIPLRRKTADQLETGHFFTGTLSDKSGEWGEYIMCVVGEPGTGNHIRYAADFMPSEYPASEWVVIEDHGPFQKPEGK